jgi:hypothetical protein
MQSAIFALPVINNNKENTCLIKNLSSLLN